MNAFLLGFQSVDAGIKFLKNYIQMKAVKKLKKNMAKIDSNPRTVWYLSCFCFLGYETNFYILKEKKTLQIFNMSSIN